MFKIAKSQPPWNVWLLIKYGHHIVMYYFYAYYTVESGIKQLNLIELNKVNMPWYEAV